MFRVLVVDDRSEVRESVAKLLRTATGAEVSAAKGGDDAVLAISDNEWNLVVLNPGDDGLETLRRLTAKRPGLPIIIHSLHVDRTVLTPALLSSIVDVKDVVAGRMGVGSMSPDPKRVVLSRIAQSVVKQYKIYRRSSKMRLSPKGSRCRESTGGTGSKSVRPAAIELQAPVEIHPERLHQNVDQGLGSRHHALTPREYDVMLRIATAQSVRTISTELQIPIKTIGEDRAQILSKLALQDNADILRYIVDNNLIPRQPEASRNAQNPEAETSRKTYTRWLTQRRQVS